MAKESEHNFVADAHNWEQRIKVENEAAQIWTNNWGSLYAPAQNTDYEGKIKALEAKMTAIPTQALATNTMLSYLGDKPFNELRAQNYGKKTFGKFESFGVEGVEELDEAFRPQKGGQK